MPGIITPAGLAKHLAAGRAAFILDVREAGERAKAMLPDQQHIPLGELPARAGEVRPPPGALVVVYCHHGVRSAQAAAFLKKAGLGNPLSLAGGIEAWSREVDPAVPVY